MPAPGTMVQLRPAADLPILKGIKVHPDDPLKFEFIIDEGDKGDGHLIKTEANKLIKYFLASLTTPEKDLWVNLSPYEKDRIVPESFGQTEMGRDLLAQDYLLKQITASLVYPEGDIGKQFWKKVYELSGNKNVPVNTFNKVWIVPDKAVVYENAKSGTAYVVESSLKVLTEQDYLAQDKNAAGGAQAVRFARSLRGTMALSPATPRGDGLSEDERNSWATGPAHAIRDLVIPQLTKEVNMGANFAQLRQVYNSLILATWYKKKIKDSLLTKVYADQNKVDGIKVEDPQEKQRIYGQYLEAFKKGTYNYIKEERDLVSGQLVPRKYFSGGVTYMGIDQAMSIVSKMSGWFSDLKKASLVLVGCRLEQTKADQPSVSSLVPMKQDDTRTMKNYTIDDDGFMTGSIYDQRFIEDERKRSQEKPTIVFDLSGTLIVPIAPYLRTGIDEQLIQLKEMGYRLVLWSNGRKSTIENLFYQFPQMRSLFDVVISSENGMNALHDFVPLYLQDKFLRDLFSKFGASMPYGNEADKPIHLFGYKLLVDDTRFSGKFFHSYEIGYPFTKDEPDQGLANRLDVMASSSKVFSLNYEQWQAEYGHLTAGQPLKQGGDFAMVIKNRFVLMDHLDKSFQEQPLNMWKIIKGQIPAKDIYRELVEELNKHRMAGAVIDMERIDDAYQLVMTHHITDRLGRPYAVHPLEMALYMVKVLGITDQEALLAAILHDAPEDTEVEHTHVDKQFGVGVSSIVADLTEDTSYRKNGALRYVSLANLRLHGRLASKIEHIDRIEMNNNPKSIVIKVVDRLNNIYNAFLSERYLAMWVQELDRWESFLSSPRVREALKEYPQLVRELRYALKMEGQRMGRKDNEIGRRAAVDAWEKALISEIDSAMSGFESYKQMKALFSSDPSVLQKGWWVSFDVDRATDIPEDDAPQIHSSLIKMITKAFSDGKTRFFATQKSDGSDYMEEGYVYLPEDLSREELERIIRDIQLDFKYNTIETVSFAAIEAKDIESIDNPRNDEIKYPTALHKMLNMTDQMKELLRLAKGARLTFRSTDYGNGLEFYTEDKAQISAQAPGGIDFKAEGINVENRSLGGEIRLHLDPAAVQRFENIQGFSPVIIHVLPLDNLLQFLGAA